MKNLEKKRTGYLHKKRWNDEDNIWEISRSHPTRRNTQDQRFENASLPDVDSGDNGESEVVAAFIVTNKEEQTIRSMIQTFKEHNPAWEQVMVERKTLTSEMPAISLLICLFHVLSRHSRRSNQWQPTVCQSMNSYLCCGRCWQRSD